MSELQQLPRQTEMYRATIHALQRDIERDIYPTMIEDAIEDGEVSRAGADTAKFTVNWLSLTVELVVSITPGSDGIRDVITMYLKD